MRRIWTPDVEVDTLQTLGDRGRRLREELQALKDTVASQQAAAVSDPDSARATSRAEEEEPER